MEMITTIMVYKFTNLNRQEIEAMLNLRLEETRVYREAKQEGREEGREEGEQLGRQQEAFSLILRQLARRLHQDLSQDRRDRLSTLSIEQLEELGEALLDFAAIADLETWLQAHEASPNMTGI